MDDAQEQGPGAGSEEPPFEVESFLEEKGRSSIAPWLVPIAVIIAFFAFVALLVFFIV